MSQNKYWQSFGEFKEDDAFQKKQQDEFSEDLPFEGFDGKGLLEAKAPRRDFLKYLGFSTAAATLAASCKTPVRQAIPFANKPEDIVPGVAKYYATTYVQDGDVIPVVAKVRDGRPIKIEGNELCTYTNGGTSAHAQASVLDLYDTHRLRFPHVKKGEGFDEATYETIDKAVLDGINAATGDIVLLTSTITSPSTRQAITEFIGKFPRARHIQADAVSYSGMLLANEASGFGRKLPTYKFEAAKVIVSLGADFLGTWLNAVENARGYGMGRVIDEKSPAMSKHYQFESYLSTTGASADQRFTHRPSETGAVALALLAALDGSVSAPSLDQKLVQNITAVANDLKANNGAALVVCGSNDMNVQVIVNAINNAIGANGTTIDWSAPVNYRQGIDKDLVDLVTQMDAGQVGALLIYGANPVYNYHDRKAMERALGKVRLKVSFSGRMDETAKLCNYILPTHHYLESWGDAEPKTGYISFIQPTINPLFKTRPFQTALLKWSGNPLDYDTYFRNYWSGKIGSGEAFDKALQDGIYDGKGTSISTTPTPSVTTDTTRTPASSGAPAAPTTISGGRGSYAGGGVAAAAAAIAGARKAAGHEVVLYQKVSIGSGSGATNPFLQELPDIISKASWDNYAMMSLPMAKELLGINLIDGTEKEHNNYEYHPSKPVIQITVPGKDPIELPVLIIPGMNANTIAVAVGYGRNNELGRTAAGVGQNVYPLASFNGTTINYHSEASIKSAGRSVKVAQMQIHNSYENRVEVVRETTLGTFKKYPTTYPEYRKKLQDNYAKSTGDYRVEGTLYGDHPQPGLKWGMNIDMNACYGCNACVVACHVENNVPVVGKSEVLRYHDMHWLRIDRYFVTDETNPDNLKGVVFQPMLCQHCDNAPCENVCPVAATNHSQEGINQMAYNRCIGTRYCANNCPFKVRRFNWADYNGADSFRNNRDQQLVGKLDPVIEQMNDDLTRMVLNPDVTVRSRGVMEKCTFCIQKIQLAKLDAKKLNRPLLDGEAKTACQLACSAKAIEFGNVHDKNSKINKVRNENVNRTFYSLEQLHVLPNITYLAKVRNSDEVIEPKRKGSALDIKETVPAGGKEQEVH